MAMKRKPTTARGGVKKGKKGIKDLDVKGVRGGSVKGGARNKLKDY